MQVQPNENRRHPTRHPGVYFKTLRDGRRSYQIGFTDSDGKWRWQAVPGGERDAVNARADVLGKLARKERVAPSKVTFEEFAREWLDGQTKLAERTVEHYDRSLRLYLIPAFGRFKLGDVDEDRITRLIAKMEKQGLEPWTIRGTLTPLGRILNHAVRRGLIPQNPYKRLERDERPRVERGERRILSRDEVDRVLEHALPAYKPLITTAVWTGMRLMELLGLVWEDVDFDAQVIRVRYQLSRKQPRRVSLKTPAAERDIILAAGLARVLRGHKLKSRYSQPGDFVFASATGTPLSFTNTGRRGLTYAAEKAKLRKPWPTMHDCRHTFASLMIAQGADVVFVSKQLGHANPSVTLGVYAHEFGAAQHGERFRELLDGALGVSPG